MLAVTGYRTTIVQALKGMAAEDVIRIDSESDDVPVADRYLLAAGVMYSKPANEQTFDEWITSVRVNFTQVVRICEAIFSRPEPAVVCIIGSQSAEAGSYDGTYAACKRAVQEYVSVRKTQSGHRLVCVSPPIIADSGMTLRRHDYPLVLSERRTVTAQQVAEAVYRLLYRSDETNIIEAM